MSDDSTYAKMDEEQQAHFSATTVDYSAPRHYPATTEESYQRPTGVNVSALLMYAGIVLNVLFAITGFVGLIKLGAMPVVGGGGIQNINIGYLGGFVMFMFLLYAALGIACELRIPIVLSRVPILGTLPGRAGYYFFLAMHSFGAAGDLGISTAVFLLVLSILNAVAFFLAR